MKRSNSCKGLEKKKKCFLNFKESLQLPSQHIQVLSNQYLSWKWLQIFAKLLQTKGISAKSPTNFCKKKPQNIAGKLLQWKL